MLQAAHPVSMTATVCLQVRHAVSRVANPLGIRAREFALAFEETDF